MNRSIRTIDNPLLSLPKKWKILPSWLQTSTGPGTRRPNPSSEQSTRRASTEGTARSKSSSKAQGWANWLRTRGTQRIDP